MVFVEVDKEVGFHKDLVVRCVYILIGVVMSDEPADALDVGFGVVHRFEDGASRRRAFLLLILSVAAAVFCLGGMYADVVKYGC